MELNANTHPVLKTALRFEGGCLVTENDDSYRVNVGLEFRSFLSGEPFQALERLTAEIVEGKNSFSSYRDLQARYQLKEEIPDTTGQVRLLPFSARLILPTRIDVGTGTPARLPLKGSVIDLHPLPDLRVLFPQQDGGDSSQRVWGEGFAFRDLMFSMTQLQTSSEGSDTESRTATAAHIYPIQIAGAAGRFLTFPGGRTGAQEMMADLVAEASRKPREKPAWTRHPDHCLSVPAATFGNIEDLHRRYVALRAMLRATTGYSPSLVSILSPVDTRHMEGRFCLFGQDRGDTLEAVQTIPFCNDGISLAPVLETCWPRVEHLLRVGFNFVALSGWFHRGKDVEPIEQGFLNLFVFLECLKTHWVRIRERITRQKFPKTFKERVNRTIEEILGCNRERVDEFVTFRNRMVHEGVSGLPVDELIKRYCELYRLCAAVYLSLIGWTGKWGAIQAPRDRPLRVTTNEAWWKPPSLETLLPGVSGASTSR